MSHPVEGGPDELAAVMRSLRREHGVRSLLCEGGPHLFNSLLAANLVDEFFLTLAPTLVGGTELSITAGAQLAIPTRLQLIRALARNDHLFLRYARHQP